MNSRLVSLPTLYRYGSGFVALVSAAISAALSSMYFVALVTRETSSAWIFAAAWLCVFGLLGWVLLRLRPIPRALVAAMLIAACWNLLPRHNCGSEDTSSVSQSCQ